MCDHISQATSSHKRPLIQNTKIFPFKAFYWVGTFRKRTQSLFSMTVEEFSTVLNLFKQLLYLVQWSGLCVPCMYGTALLRIWEEVLKKKITWIYIYRNLKMRCNIFFEKIRCIRTSQSCQKTSFDSHNWPHHGSDHLFFAF